MEFQRNSEKVERQSVSALALEKPEKSVRSTVNVELTLLLF